MPYRIETLVLPQERNQPLSVKFPFNGKGIFRSSYTTNDQARTNLISLLLTTKGERRLQPNFGTNIPAALFDPITEQTSDFLKQDITESINFWLPYLQINNVTVITPFDDSSLNENTIKITVSVAVTNTNSNITVTLFANENGIQIEG